VLTTDPGTGIIRHADAGYQDAKTFSKDNSLKVPML
jgi:urocanate hydratase